MIIIHYREVLVGCVIEPLVGAETPAKVPTSYYKNPRDVSGVSIEYSHADLNWYLFSADAITACHQMSYYRLENGACDVSLLKYGMVEFRTDRPMPSRVFLGFTSKPIRARERKYLF